MFRIMSKLKTSFKAGMSKIAQYKHFSSDAQDELNNTFKQNEIVTDKFRKELTYIIQCNKRHIKYQPSEKQSISSTAQTVSEQSNEFGFQLSNITGSPPIITDFPEIPVQGSLEQSCNDNNSDISLKKVSNSSMEISNLKNLLPFKANMTPVVINQIVSEQNRLSTTQADLTSAVVPLSLHTGDKNLIVDSLVEDVNQLYNKTSGKIDFWSLVIQNHGRTCYIELEKFFKQPETPQNFVREQVVSRLSELKEKTVDNIICLCEAKVPSTENKTEKKTEESSTVSAGESLLDKIKKTIENLMSSLKEKMEENKKKANEAKSK